MALRSTNLVSSTVIPMPLRAPSRKLDWQTPAKCQFAVEGQPMTVTLVDSPAELAAHQVAWEDLARYAIEANVFYEPWMFLPAWELLGRHQDLRCVLIYTTGPSNEGSPQVLCGFFPLEKVRGYKGLPITYSQLWRTPQMALCTPLIRAAYARDCLNAFFDWLGKSKTSGSLLALPYLSGDGLFNQLLTDFTNDGLNLFTIEERTNRAVLTRRASGEDYLNLALSGKRRKELRRQEKLLRELGDVEYVEYRPGDDLEVWLERFLTLEALGWKGAEGTALAQQHETRELFLRTMRAAAGRERLMMLALRLNGQPIAMKCSVQTGVAAFALKIAYDEKYGHYSPGVHLELENVRRFHEHPQLQWMDSCATSRHFMINRLWVDRRSLKRVLIATGKAGGNFIVGAIPLLRWCKRKFIKSSAENATSLAQNLASLFFWR